MSSKIKKIKPKVFKSKVKISGTLGGLLSRTYTPSYIKSLYSWVFTDFFGVVIPGKRFMEHRINLDDEWYYQHYDLMHIHKACYPVSTLVYELSTRATECKCGQPIPEEIMNKLKFIFSGYVRDESAGFGFPVKL